MYIYIKLGEGDVIDGPPIYFGERSSGGKKYVLRAPESRYEPSLDFAGRQVSTDISGFGKPVWKSSPGDMASLCSLCSWKYWSEHSICLCAVLLAGGRCTRVGGGGGGGRRRESGSNVPLPPRPGLCCDQPQGHLL